MNMLSLFKSSIDSTLLKKKSKENCPLRFVALKQYASQERPFFPAPFPLNKPEKRGNYLVYLAE